MGHHLPLVKNAIEEQKMFSARVFEDYWLLNDGDAVEMKRHNEYLYLKFLILELDMDSFPLGLNILNFYLSVAS